MIELDPTRFKLKPYLHQLRGTGTLLRKPVYGLFWKMRLGKSKAVIDAACTLMEAGMIDTVLVCCPAQVKDVWLNKDFGEIKSHAWLEVDRLHYQGKSKEAVGDLLRRFSRRSFVVTSFEYLRQEDAYGDFPLGRYLVDSLRLGRRRVMLVMDEGSALGTWNSQQVKVMMKIRYADVIKRVVLLDGTPAGNSPLCLYSKFALLNKDILGCRNFWQFRGRYADIMKRKGSGHRYEQIVGFKNLEDLTYKTKEYCEYLGQETLDMPRKVPSLLTVALKPKAWKVYKQMRDEMIAQLDCGTLAVNNAAVKALRLAQICSGFLGGWDNPDDPQTTLTEEVGSEATDTYLEWVTQQIAVDPKFKTIVWCRWRPEIERLVSMLAGLRINVGCIYGGKNENMEWFHPSSTMDEAAVGVGQVQAAQYGKNYSRATAVTYLSQDYNLVSRQQSEDRVQAPKVRATTLMMDVEVTGPDGQLTVVHDIIKVQRTKENLANRTVEKWKEVLRDE